MHPAIVAVVAAGLAGAAAYYYRGRSAAGPGQLEPPPKILPTRLPPLGYPVRPPAGISLDGISPAVDAVLQKIEQDETKAPQDVAGLARKLERKGLFTASARLDANALWRGRTLQGWPYVIKAGDTPAGIAQRYTGTAGRWRELAGRPVTPGGRLVAYTDQASGYEQLKPWKVGSRISIPLTWPIVPMGGGLPWTG